MKPFSFQRPADLQTFIHRAEESASLLSPEGAVEYGIFTQADGGTLLRPADDAPRPYLHGLLHIREEGARPADVQAFYGAARALGAPPATLIGRYLTTARDGEARWDFCECWMPLGCDPKK